MIPIKSADRTPTEMQDLEAMAAKLRRGRPRPRCLPPPVVMLPRPTWRWRDGALRLPFGVFFEQLPRKLDAGGDVLEHCLRTGTLRMQEHPKGFGEDDLVFKNGALDFIHHLCSLPLLPAATHSEMFRASRTVSCRHSTVMLARS